MTDWDTVLAAVGVALSGDREAGRRHLLAAWDGTAATDHAQRCVLAHHLADLQDDLPDEAAWDERALAEHGPVRDADLAGVGIPSAAGLAPSLHLNLGDVRRRQGRARQAREHADAGLALVDALGDDGYGALVRQGLVRLRGRVDDPG